MIIIMLMEMDVALDVDKNKVMMAHKESDVLNNVVTPEYKGISNVMMEMNKMAMVAVADVKKKKDMHV